MSEQETTTNYLNGYLDRAYNYFNEMLFAGSLTPVVITLRAKPGKARGFYAAPEIGFVTANDEQQIAEIAIHIQRKDDSAGILSTLVHEMVHHRQELEGKPSKGAYHNKQWCQMMMEIGLTPVNDRGQVELKATGRSVTHTIDDNGEFDQVCKQWLDDNGPVPVFELPKPKKNYTKKTKYACPFCDIVAYGKPDLYIICGNCDSPLGEY